MEPRDDQDDREPDQQRHEDELERPRGNLEHAEQQLGHLQQQPRRGEIDRRRLDHLAAPEFGQEVHLGSRCILYVRIRESSRHDHGALRCGPRTSPTSGAKACTDTY